MISSFLEMLSYPFLMNGLIVGILVSLCASLLGVSLVLKRYSLIGEGLSHVGFATLAIAYALNVAPLVFSIPICILSAFLLLQLNNGGKLKGDGAIALLCSGALAIGVMTISLTTGMNTDVCNYMFGSILAMSESDVILSIVLSVIVLIIYVLFYHRIFAITFDEGFVKAGGGKSSLYNAILAVLTAVIVVIGMRMMGTLLISSLIVFPTLSAMRVFKKYLHVVICAAVISVVTFVVGIYISYMYSTPTGASIVCMDMFVFIVMLGIGKVIRL